MFSVEQIARRKNDRRSPAPYLEPVDNIRRRLDFSCVGSLPYIMYHDICCPRTNAIRRPAPVNCVDPPRSPASGRRPGSPGRPGTFSLPEVRRKASLAGHRSRNPLVDDNCRNQAHRRGGLSRQRASGRVSHRLPGSGGLEPARRDSPGSAKAAKEAAQVLARAVDLRETIYRIFSRAAAGRRPDPSGLAVLNEALAKANGRLLVVPKGQGFAWAGGGRPGSDALAGGA